MQRQLATLESEVAQSAGAPPLGQYCPMTSVQGLALALEKVLRDMQDGESVPQTLVAATQEQMHTLYNTIASILAAVASTATPPATKAVKCGGRRRH